MTRGAPNPRPAPKPGPGSTMDATGRTHRDYAIEHAEYMATAAESFLEVFNKCITEDTEFDSTADVERLGEAAHTLRSYIY